jgi:hypothetical protein
MIKSVFFIICILLNGYLVGQTDTLKQNASPLKIADYNASDSIVFLYKSASTLVNSQSSITLKKRTLQFNIEARFGNVINSSLNSSAHSAFGLDNIGDLRLSADYGITDNITVGIGRSKYRELLDGSIKWRFLTQSKKIPLSICAYVNAGYSAMPTSQIYEGTVKPITKEAHRLQYVSQVLLARQFNKHIYVQLMPTYVHRNFMKELVNTNNYVEDANDLFSMGVGTHIKLSNCLAFVADYFYNFSKFQRNNPTPYYNVLGVGLEIHKKGYFIKLNVTNNTAIMSSSFLPSTQDAWTKGQFKLGVSISKHISL